MNQDAGDFFDGQFAGAPIMAILRGYSQDRTIELAEQAWRLGIDTVEVPVQDSASLEVLRAVAIIARQQGRPVGAGTILEPADVTAVADAGAGFTVSPGFDPAVARAAKELGMPHLPGVATGSEVQAAWLFGLRWLKAFPAGVLGPDWFRAMRGPFPGVSFVATGGIDASAAEAYLSAGARVVASGAALSDPDELARFGALLDRRRSA